jgi:hypothetical protein
MALVLRNRVRATTSTTGTGAYSLGAATPGFLSFSVIGDNNQTYYSITNDTDWETGLGTFTEFGSVLSRDQIFASSNSGNLVNWGAGNKQIFVPFPAEATQGSTPNVEDAAVGTNLIAWNGYTKLLNNNTQGGSVVSYGLTSTYGSGVLGGTNNYSRGVFTPMSEKFFIFYNGTNNAGRIGFYQNAFDYNSSYTITLTASEAYSGGVYLPNGEMHFIPYKSNVGQKIIPGKREGFSSETYALARTSTVDIKFNGGVLAGNGEAYFVPFSVDYGMKLSSSGTSSTFTLAYTTAGAYSGGVLAPNGDVHFCPSSAAVGQKISASGTVSTYSLAYTTSSAYVGGLLSPDGSIHFIPYSAAVGQKVDINGAVSTYSLVYTTTAAYSGGVLASDGSIHFVPYNAVRGQRISRTGQVSTYAIASTSANRYFGAILTPEGRVSWVDANATVTVTAVTLNSMSGGSNAGVSAISGAFRPYC